MITHKAGDEKLKVGDAKGVGEVLRGFCRTE
jgi:hypothetical protein